MIFVDTFAGKSLATFLMAMVPVVELRGAIPYGVAAGLPVEWTFILAVLGNLVPVPFIMLLVRQAFNLLRAGKWWGPRIASLERRAHLKGRIVTKYRLAGLLLLVAVPLPGTGEWTGALVATLLNIRMKNALPAIFIGLVIAGIITSAVTMGLVALF